MIALISFLLQNWKTSFLSIALITMLFWNFLLHYQNLKLVNENQSCQTTHQLDVAAIQAAQTMRLQQEEWLKLKEQENAKALAASKKRMEFLLAANIPNECNAAIQKGIGLASDFNWHNGTP